jgi:hypothetical protein
MGSAVLRPSPKPRFRKSEAINFRPAFFPHPPSPTPPSDSNIQTPSSALISPIPSGAGSVWPKSFERTDRPSESFAIRNQYSERLRPRKRHRQGIAYPTMEARIRYFSGATDFANSGTFCGVSLLLDSVGITRIRSFPTNTHRPRW